MNLTLEMVVEGDTAVVTCRGHIVHGTTARRFRECIARMLRRHRRVVLDLGGVTNIDAGGVGMLAVLIAQAKSADRRLAVAMSSDRVKRVLQITGLDVQLQNESRVRDWIALRAEADEDRGLLGQAVARSNVGPHGARTGWQGATAHHGQADCRA